MWSSLQLRVGHIQIGPQCSRAPELIALPPAIIAPTIFLAVDEAVDTQFSTTSRCAENLNVHVRDFVNVSSGLEKDRHVPLN